MPTTCSGLCLILSMIVGTASPAVAQQAPPKPDEIQTSKPESAASGSYVVESKQTRVRMEADGRSSRELTIRVRIVDALGVRQWGQIPFPYAFESEEIEIRQMEVRKADGRVIAIGPESIQELSANQQGQVTFVDLRQKHVTVPSLQPGDTLALSVVWVVARPLVPGHSWAEYSFSKQDIVEDEEFEISLPSTMTAVVRAAPSAPVEESNNVGQVAGGRRVYRWRSKNLHVATTDDEDDDSLDEAPVPDVRVSTFRDWTAFAEWLRPLLQPAPDAAVRSKALELTKDLTDEKAKIKALYTYVAQQIRYVSLSFGVGRFSPHAPADVLKNQYGDCKDKHALLAAMLQAIGVRTVPVLLNTSRSVSKDMPSPAEFDHVITAIPEGTDPSRWTWLDTTTEVAPFGMLFVTTRDRDSLSLGNSAIPAAIVRTPLDPPFPSTERIVVDAEVNPYGVLNAQVHVALRGDAEVILRSLARVLPRENLKEAGKEFVRNFGFKGEVSDFTLGDPLATEEPFDLRFKLRRGGYLDWAAASSKLEDILGRFDVSVFDGAAHPLKKDRKMGTPVSTRRTLTLKLPAAYRATAPSGSQTSVGEFKYSSMYSVTVTGQVLSLTREYTGQPRTLVVAESPNYTRMARAIAADVAQAFTVERVDHTRAEIPPGMSASELYSAGYSGYMSGDYDAAFDLWTRTTQADPKLANGWSGLGLAARQLRKYDEAVAAFEKQISLEPSSKRAHKDLAEVLKQAHRLEEAARAYARHLELNPSDGEAQKSLGGTYQDLKDHERAITSLERAATLLPEDAWVPAFLGGSYLKVGQTQKALAAHDRALGLDRTPAVMTKIAWQLAEHGGYDSRALELVTEATASISATVAALTPAAIRPEHFDLMERLAWCWDARGMIALRKGDLEGAVRYFDAAWRLGGQFDMIEHLGQAYERMSNRSSDALSAYLVARSLRAEPRPALMERIKRLAGSADVEPLMKAAQAEFVRQRGTPIPKEWPEGKAEFRAVLDGKGRPLSAVMDAGADAFRALESKLIELKLPVSAPDDGTARLPVRLVVLCPPSGKVCAVVVEPARSAARGGSDAQPGTLRP